MADYSDCPMNNETGRPTGANTVLSQNRRYDARRDTQEVEGSTWRDRGNSGRGNWKEKDGRRDSHDYRDRPRQDERSYDRYLTDNRDRYQGRRDKGYSRDSHRSQDDRHLPGRRSRDRSVERDYEDTI